MDYLTNVLDFITNNMDILVWFLIGSFLMFLVGAINYGMNNPYYEIGDILIPDGLEHWEAAAHKIKILETGTKSYLVEHLGGEKVGKTSKLYYANQVYYSKAEK